MNLVISSIYIHIRSHMIQGIPGLFLRPTTCRTRSTPRLKLIIFDKDWQQAGCDWHIYQHRSTKIVVWQKLGGHIICLIFVVRQSQITSIDNSIFVDTPFDSIKWQKSSKCWWWCNFCEITSFVDWHQLMCLSHPVCRWSLSQKRADIPRIIWDRVWK